MASDDMYVIMYRIIAYVYSCNKQGAKPELSEWDSMALGIPEQYWAQILYELRKDNLIEGVDVYPTGDGLKAVPVSPRVTKEGVAFAHENSMMGKAKQALMDIKASVPFI